ncbi:MAG: TonB-dependent receptor [Candidatus Methylacidiphilales bacterium]
MPKTKPANKHRRTHRPGSVATLAAANVLMMTGATMAQETAPAKKTTATPAKPSTTAKKDAAPTAETGSGNLSEVVVTAKPEGSYQVEKLQSTKLTEPIINIPQTIVVVPKAVIQDQAASSLREILTNVPGISFTAGEGGALAGDNLSIRGFNARSDIFVDGFRDSGVYNRDGFNLEQVEVIKGPASTYSGHGSTGGSVNLVTKDANLRPRYEASFGLGTEGNDIYSRNTVDINQPLDQWIPTTAVRLNALYQYDGMAPQDEVYNNRWALFPSIAWGLGTETRVTANYLYQQEDNLPTYGIMHNSANLYQGNPSLGNNYTKYADVDFSNFYGMVDRDYEHTVTHVPTLKIEHDFCENLKIENTARYSYTARESVLSPPRSGTGTVYNPATNTLQALTTPYPADTMIRELRARHQVDQLVGNQFMLTGKFDTWKLNHTVVATLEYSRETEDYRTNQTARSPSSRTSLSNPGVNDPYPFSVLWGPESHTELEDIAFSLFDTIKFGEQWILAGGMRFDHVYSHQTVDAFAGEAAKVTPQGTLAAVAASPAAEYQRTDDLLSWRIGLTYKPAPNGSVYFGYGTSFNPQIESGASPSTIATTSNLGPEENETYEVGTKWDFLNERLSLTAALFRTNKNNARITDPTDGTTQVLAGEQRVQGIELGVSGNITPEWSVFGGYSYMDSQIIKGTNAGNELPNTPEQSASLWTTYKLPYNVKIGTGFQYVDTRYSSIANTVDAPGYVTQQAMVGWSPTKNVEVQINVNNLWDEQYISALGGGHSVPGYGRNVIVTTNIKF